MYFSPKFINSFVTFRAKNDHQPFSHSNGYNRFPKGNDIIYNKKLNKNHVPSDIKRSSFLSPIASRG